MGKAPEPGSTMRTGSSHAGHAPAAGARGRRPTNVKKELRDDTAVLEVAPSVHRSLPPLGTGSLRPGLAAALPHAVIGDRQPPPAWWRSPDPSRLELAPPPAPPPAAACHPGQSWPDPSRALGVGSCSGWDTHPFPAWICDRQRRRRGRSRCSRRRLTRGRRRGGTSAVGWSHREAGGTTPAMVRPASLSACENRWWSGGWILK
jgi:hypothetical protein